MSDLVIHTLYVTSRSPTLSMLILYVVSPMFNSLHPPEQYVCLWNGHVDSSRVSIGFNSSSQTAAPLAQQMDGTCIVNALWNTRLCHAVIIHLTGCLHSVIHLGNESDDRKVWLYNLNNHVYIPWEWFSSPCSMLPSLSSVYRPRKRADQACQSQFLFCLCSISPPTCSYII